MDERDCERFQMLLYACNSKKPLHISTMSSNHQGPALTTVLGKERGEALVDIAAYCLMPNHPHLLLREIDDGGISTFMQKLGTGYTMYFNKKYHRPGALFSGRFKAVHVERDAHFRRLLNYIHANPAELYEPRWKEGIIRNEGLLRKKLLAYPFSSLLDYEGVGRPHSTIINIHGAMELLDTTPSFKTLLADARVFYRREKDFVGELER